MLAKMMAQGEGADPLRHTRISPTELAAVAGAAQPPVRQASYSKPGADRRARALRLGSKARGAYDEFRTLGYDHNAAAALIGNMLQESGQRQGGVFDLRPTVSGDNGNSFGSVQWNGPRRKAFFAWAKDQGLDPADIRTQARYVDVELRSTERGARSAFTAGDPGQIAVALSDRFWRPGDPRNENRVRYALLASDQFGGASSGTSAAPVFDPEKFKRMLAERRNGAAQSGSADRQPSAFAMKFIPGGDKEQSEQKAVSDYAMRFIPGGEEEQAESAAPVFDPEKFRAMLNERKRGAAQREPSAPTPAPDDQSWATGFMDSVTDGIAFGLGDELTALENDILQSMGFDKHPLHGGPTAPYDEALARERAQQAAFAEQNPASAIAGEVMGATTSALATGGGSLLANATTRGGQVARAAAGGAAAAGVYGFNEGEGGAVDRAVEGALAAPVGAMGGIAGRELAIAAQRALRRVVGSPALFQDGRITEAGRKVLQKAGIDPAQISDDFALAFASRVKQAQGLSDEAARLAVADEAGIPLTRGQATGDLGQIAFEEAARSGARGNPALQTVQAIDSKAREGTARRVEDLAQGFGGQAEGTALSAAEDVVGGVKDAAQRQRYRAAYQAAEEAGAVIDVRALSALEDLAETRLSQATFARSPQAQGALDEIKRLAANAKAGPEGTVGIAFDAIEDVRQKMNRIRAADPQVMAEIGVVREALDDWAEDAMDSALIHGSEDALRLMQTARQEFAAFKRMFSRRSGDDASQIIANLAERDVTPAEAANWLFGSVRVGAKGSSVRVANRLKEILPAAEWDQVRAGAWRRVVQTATGDPMTPQKIQARIKDFAAGEGEALAKALFSTEEIAQMRRFAKAMEFLVPPGRATNPSGTGYEIGRMITQMWDQSLMLVGLAQAGPAGAVAARMSSAASQGLGDSLRAGNIPARGARRTAGSASRRRETGAAAVGAGGVAGSEREGR